LAQPDTVTYQVVELSMDQLAKWQELGPS
jgi:hypothetical protein